MEEAPFIWIAHDVGPRAIAAKVRGVVQPRSRFIDIATLSIEGAAPAPTRCRRPPRYRADAHHVAAPHQPCGADLGLLVLAAFGPWLVPADPYQVSLLKRLAPVGSPGYPLGSDELGRDRLSR